jgi:hypothetical protein
MAAPAPASALAAPSSKQLKDQARQLLDQRKYADAMPILGQALMADRNDILALQLRYTCYRRLNKVP